MSRRTRRQYHETRPPTRRKPTAFADAMEMLKRTIKRRAIELGHIVAPQPSNYWWEYFVPTPCDKGTLMTVGYITGPTKSEARAALKRELGRKLPPHTKLVWSGECK